MLNASASRAAKQTGQQLALDMAGDWKVDVLVELRAWLAVHRAQGHRDMTMEQFRAQAVNQPASHKAWGPLPALACKAGLIAPLTHADGSPVMRRAESVRTHSHPVRVWHILDFFITSETGTRSASSHDEDTLRAQRQPSGIDGCGAVLHGGDGAALLAATADYHRGRAEMGGA